MEVCRKSSWLLTLLGVILLAEALQGVQGEVEIGVPSESECRPYIEKALRKLEHVDDGDAEVGQSNEEPSSIDDFTTDEKQSDEQRSQETSEVDIETQESTEDSAATDSQTDELKGTDATSSETIEVDAENEKTDTDVESGEKADEPVQEEEVVEDLPSQEESETQSENIESTSSAEKPTIDETETQTTEEASKEDGGDSASVEETSIEASKEESLSEIPPEIEEPATQSESTEDTKSAEASQEQNAASNESLEKPQDELTEEIEVKESVEDELTDRSDEVRTSSENTDQTSTESESEKELEETKDEGIEAEESTNENLDATEDEKVEDSIDQETDETVSAENLEHQREKRDVGDSERTTTEIEEGEVSEEKTNEEEETKEEEKKHEEEEEASNDHEHVESTESTTEQSEESKESLNEKNAEEPEEILKDTSEQNEDVEKHEEVEKSEEVDPKEEEKSEEVDPKEGESKEPEDTETSQDISGSEEKVVEKSDDPVEDGDSLEEGNSQDAPEEELINGMEIPEDLRSRAHVEQLLKLDKEATKTEEIIDRVSEITQRELKRLYENAIKPLETLYKYRDLSNRHYGDAEIFSKPLILFMGPWSGGKSSIINYLLNVEYNDTALRTGAEPSPAYFNLLMYGEEEEVLDGTQLAADYTFSGLQKFGQGLEERLRGLKLKSKLLEKVNIVEIPGILEVRKQISRVFPFNDACQWFIDRADIIFLVYDPFKLDVGPETEAILDQLKGREYQTRIILNKADQVKPEELMRVQGALIWNISPLMSSPQPPIMYTTSLWSRPYEQWAPVRLLQAQERAFLRDLRTAVDRRIENKIASARRFAVRVRNHAKMVDCYLTTYYNHKSIFGNKKQVSDAIIEHPQDYHIYEGLSTLTNISRYDLPDPEVYRDFFKLNPLYEFQQLSATCTYFRGCPINKLDVAIAYDLPELVGKHKRLVESALTENSKQEQSQGS